MKLSVFDGEQSLPLHAPTLYVAKELITLEKVGLSVVHYMLIDVTYVAISSLM